MISFVLAIAFSILQADSAQRATRPSFRGAGQGELVVLKVPESVSLAFFVVRCARGGESDAVFEVFRSGDKASPFRADASELYREQKSGVTFRIDPGPKPFEVGDTFSFVTYEDASFLDELLERWAEQYVKWILSTEEKELFEKLEDPAEKLAFIESFWRRRDPNPETPENEAREEHARRFAYAVQHFGAGTPGWATDRGKIYILLGPPSAIERNPAGRTAFERPSELWTYNDPPNPKLPASMDIAFVDFTATGNYELVSASNLDILAPLRTNLGYAMSELEAIGLLRSGGSLLDQATGLRHPIRPTEMATEQFDFQRDLLEIRKVPQLTKPDLAEATRASAAFPSIPLSLEASFFRGESSRALVPVTLAIPYARLTPEPAGESYRYQVDLVIEIRGGETEEVPPIEDRLEVTTSLDELATYRESELLYEASLVLPPGRYEMIATIRDNPSGAVGQTTSSVEIPPLDAEGLRLSSLLLANGAIETALPPPGERAPFQFATVRLVPNVGKNFHTGESLTAYLQAYGFTREPRSGRAQLRVEFFLLKDGRLYSKVAPTLHRPEGEGEIAVRSEISLRDFPPGDYVLKARITDELSGATAERENAFTIAPKRASDR